MEIIFDTNAYRTFVHGLSLPEVIKLGEKLNRHEQAGSHTSALSTVVLMELIQHLILDDPAQADCYKALTLAYHHTTKLNLAERTKGGSYYPPMNVILAQVFFNQNSNYKALYDKVIGLFLALVEMPDMKICDKYQTDIQLVKSHVLYEKEEFKNNVADFLASLNNGVINWKYINNNTEERRRYFDKLRNGDMKILLANALMLRAHHVMEVTELISDAEDRIQSFIRNYDAAINMQLTLMELIGQGVEKLQNASDPRWNTLYDVQIMFALLYKKNGHSPQVLVTQEKKIKESVTKSGIDNKVITIDQYKSLIHFL